MPVCSFFLRGVCSKEDCPYLHVSVGRDAEVCPDFLKGYCTRGEKVCRSRVMEVSIYRRFTIFHCHLIFVGRGGNGNKKMKIYNTIQNSGTVMYFLVQNLKIKNGEQLKHRNIMNEFCGLQVCVCLCVCCLCVHTGV